MTIRRVEESDRDALIRFLAQVPERDRNFFKQEIDDPEIADRWLCDRRRLRLVALDDSGEVAATVSLFKRPGWSAHVGELELIVSPGFRRRGLGREVAQRGLLEAVRMGVTHVVVEVAAEQEGLVAMFGRLGFQPEALLRDFIRDRDGHFHDLLMLTHRVRETWSELLTLGVDEAAELG